MEGKGRAATAFMRGLTRMFEERSEDIMWDAGTIIIPDRARLEKVLPSYYKMSKFSSFQRQLNNFGWYQRSSDNERVWNGGDRSKARGVCYHKVAGAPASVDIQGLLYLRPHRSTGRHQEEKRAECGAALGVRRPDRVISGCHKEDKRHPCADCEAHIAAGDEACATCGSKCQFRARERAARARLAERKKARKDDSVGGGFAERKKARSRAKKARKADSVGGDPLMAWGGLEALAAEQERLFTAAAARNAAAAAPPP